MPPRTPPLSFKYYGPSPRSPPPLAPPGSPDSAPGPDTPSTVASSSPTTSSATTATTAAGAPTTTPRCCTPCFAPTDPASKPSSPIPGPGETAEDPAIAFEARPPVPNRVVLLPVYARGELMDMLCALLPSDAIRLRGLSRVADMPARLSVVTFTEHLALCCRDLNHEGELLRGSDPIQFWMGLQEKMQDVGRLRLQTRLYTALQFDDGKLPFSNVVDDVAEAAVETEAGTEGGTRPEGDNGSPTPHEEAERARDSEEGQELVFDEHGLPVSLRLQIPEDEAGPYGF